MKVMKQHQLICLMAALLCLSACRPGQRPQQETAYNVMTVRPSNQEIITSYSASIRGRQDISILPQIGGFITKVCVTEGQKVHKGQLLFIIDQVAYKAQLKTANANVAAAEAGLATAQLTYTSKQELFKEKVISEFDLKTAENAFLTAKAQLEQAKAQKVNAENSLSYTEVKSPSDGVVGTLPYKIGALVGPEMPTPLTTISHNSVMYVYFSLNEHQLLGLMRQYGSMEKTIENMPGLKLKLSDNELYAHEGRVESISGMVDTKTGTASIRAVFPNPNYLLISGTSGNVIIPQQRNNVVVIPRSATFEIQDKVYVYKVVDGNATATPVSVTRVGGGRDYIVLNGLASGDVIVSEGVGLIREGQPIKVRQGNESNEVKKGE